MANAPYQPQALELIVNTPDVRVAEITLAPHTDTPPHEHTAVEEVCYCLEGELSCEAEGEEPVTLRAGGKKPSPRRIAPPTAEPGRCALPVPAHPRGRPVRLRA